MFKFILGFISAFGLLALIVNRILKNPTVYKWSYQSVANLFENLVFPRKDTRDKGYPREGVFPDIYWDHYEQCDKTGRHLRHTWERDGIALRCKGNVDS